jgi:hypothetical protein
MLKAADLPARQPEQNQAQSQKNLLMFGMVNYEQDSGLIRH